MSDQYLSPSSHNPVEATLDRPVFYYPPKPTLPVMELLPPEKREQPYRKSRISRILGGVAAVAASVSVFLPGEAPNLAQNELFSSGTEIVQPAGTIYYDGLKQAEQFFGQATLDRTRAAVDAYLAGDTTELSKQQAELGYHADWISAQGREAIETATTKDELEDAFHNALSGLPVTLEVADTPQAIARLDQGYEHMLAHDLGQDKKLSLSVVDTLNLLDLTSLKENLEPLKIVIVGSVVDLEDYSAGIEGYYAPAADSHDVDQIVVAEAYADERELFPHEFTHDTDDHMRRGLSEKIGQLNVDGHGYSRTNKMTEVDGWKSVNRGYGNTNSREDAATVGEDLLQEHPEISFENSPLSEKQMAFLLTFEENEPGFSAALLSRASRPEESSKLWRVAQEAWVMVIENKQRIAGVATLVLASAMGAGLIGRLRQRKFAKKN